MTTTTSSTVDDVINDDDDVTCKYRSCKADGDSSITLEASLKALEARFSPSAAMTFALASRVASASAAMARCSSSGSRASFLQKITSCLNIWSEHVQSAKRQHSLSTLSECYFVEIEVAPRCRYLYLVGSAHLYSVILRVNIARATVSCGFSKTPMFYSPIFFIHLNAKMWPKCDYILCPTFGHRQKWKFSKVWSTFFHILNKHLKFPKVAKFNKNLVTMISICYHPSHLYNLLAHVSFIEQTHFYFLLLLSCPNGETPISTSRYTIESC